MFWLDHSQNYISIHPPRVGRDPATPLSPQAPPSFQSTLPVWGGTMWPIEIAALSFDFNPPSPCGEGRVTISTSSLVVADFNPPSPCGEGRCRSPRRCRPARYFNPPSPCGEGLAVIGGNSATYGISIHPPRVGRDLSNHTMRGTCQYFNPPSPCGEGPVRIHDLLLQHTDFNPPSPCGEGQQKFTKILCKLLR